MYESLQKSFNSILMNEGKQTKGILHFFNKEVFMISNKKESFI